MNLPNTAEAVVEAEKLTGYLLNPADPDNGGKAPFFLALGFHTDDWPTLPRAFRRLAARSPVTRRLRNV
jgi:hypothetical protein